MNNSSKALGLIEVVGYPAAVEAVDSALKSANVVLGAVTKVGSGIVTVQIFGDVGAVKAAVDSGSEAASTIGELRASHIIPRIDDTVFEMITKSKQKHYKTTSIKSADKIEKKTYTIQQHHNDTDLEINNTDKADNADNTDNTDNINSKIQSLYTYEELKKKSNMDLKNMLAKLEIDTSDEKTFKSMKKEDLIQIILKTHKDDKGEV